MSISELYRSVLPPSVTPETKPELSPKLPGGMPKGPSEFKQILDGHLNLSQHAETRIRSREVPWDSQMEKRISDGIKVADSKGSREALILADNIAVIANVKSRTVITAMNRDQMKDRVFTNIDSAVLV